MQTGKRVFLNKAVSPVFGGALLLGLVSCQSVPDYRVGPDWASVTLHATGTGRFHQGSFPERMRSVQQAKEDVARKMETQILALRTDSGKTVLEWVEARAYRQRVAAYARRAEIIEMENQEGAVHLTARLFLGDSLKAILDLLPRKEISPSPPRSSGAL